MQTKVTRWLKNTLFNESVNEVCIKQSCNTVWLCKKQTIKKILQKLYYYSKSNSNNVYYCKAVILQFNVNSSVEVN